MTEQSPAEALFFAALAEPPAERAAYLDANCPDPELRGRVDKLLAAQPKVGGFLADSPAAATGTLATGDPTAAPGVATADFPSAKEHLGAVLAGKYKLIEQIGDGGMGSVFLAQQSEPVKRVVAVKVIKAGMDSKAVLARFEAERQALAMMDHPNIARVLDAGTTDLGRPFFVMELVKGVPITQYCDERKLTPRQRLELFVPVCQAIQHAHQKGVIHRDIKPGNVLVALYDDRPVPKVIDFGIAKAAGPSLTDQSLVTGLGAVLGTPEYMSPEQASFNNLDVDTRSDVYSLGVLLYELLTGSTPVDRRSLGKAALFEVLRIVREVEAPRPSDKVSTSDALPGVAANRGTEPAKLSRLMKGELDWLVLKALEKDRARRYDTANGLARDIQRYLADEVVEARPPSTGYRLRKWVRRNRVAVLAAGIVWTLTLTQVGFSTLQWLNAETARKAAEVAREEADGAQRAEAGERKKAEVAAAELAGNLGTLQRQNEATRRALMSLRDQLNSEVVLRSTPEVRASAVAQFRRVLAIFERLVDELPDPAPFRLILANEYRVMGNGLFSYGQLAEAETYYRKGIVHYRALAAGDPARPEFHQRGAALQMDLALLLRERKQPEAAEREYRAAVEWVEQLLARQPGRTDTVALLASGQYYLAEELTRRGQPAAALGHYDRAVERSREVTAARPTSRDDLWYYCERLAARARCLDGLGRAQVAAADWQEAAHLADRLSAGRPLAIPQPLGLARVCTQAATRLPDRRDRLLACAVGLVVPIVTASPTADVRSLLSHPDFHPLRDRADFRTLLATLPEVAPPPRPVVN